MLRCARLLRDLATWLPALLAAPASFAAPELTRLNFSLDWVYTGAHAPYVLAVDGGYLKREGLDVLLQRGAGSAEAVRRVAAGEADIGIADLSAVIQHNAVNPARPVTAIYLVQDRSTLSVVSLQEKQIRTPADLRGKVIAAPEGEAGRAMFPLFAAAAGIDPASVTWQSVEPALRETLLISGSVDAITGYSYTTQFLEIQGVRRDRIRVLRYADFGLDLYGSALFARADFLRRNPRTATAFVRAFNAAMLASIRQPSLAIDALKRRLGQRAFAEIESQRLRAALDEAVLTPGVRRNGLSHVDGPRLARQVEQVATVLRLPRIPDPGSVYTDAFLPPPAERQLAAAALTMRLARWECQAHGRTATAPACR